jgi:hypothetical protein
MNDVVVTNCTDIRELTIDELDQAEGEIDPSHPEAIGTVRGVGYMFAPRKA